MTDKSKKRIPWNKKYNKYDLSGEYGIGWTSNTNEEFYFDLEDYDKIKEYCWSKNACGYMVANINGKSILMHRLICNYSITDHKNRNKLDNRKENLREATTAENLRNRNIQSNNTHKVIGVYFRKERNSWYAQITINKKTRTLIYTHNKEEAIKARLQAELKYFGEFAPQRHLFKKYNIVKEEK